MHKLVIDQSITDSLVSNEAEIVVGLRIALEKKAGDGVKLEEID